MALTHAQQVMSNPETRKRFKQKIGEDIESFVNFWQGRAEAAVTSAGLPSSRLNERVAYWAVAGNMVWAASCLVPGPWGVAGKVLGIVMNFGGAAGSSVPGYLAATGAITDSKDTAVQAMQQAVIASIGKLADALSEQSNLVKVQDRVAHILIEKGEVETDNSELRPKRCGKSCSISSPPTRPGINPSSIACVRNLRRCWHIWRRPGTNTPTP